jgi:predicted dehydrogenase
MITRMPIRLALIGTGRIAVANHVPGIGLCRDAVVTALSDPSPSALAEASQATGVTRTYADGFELLRDAPVDAVIIATPNRFHRDLAVAAAESGRHVLCEKPLALTVVEGADMLAAAERAGVRHMTAFTYRFVPAMQYMHHLVTSGAVGTPWHFRAQRFQDWGRQAIGWRQRLAEAGSGEIGDMLSHRLDFGHFLVGPISHLSALTAQVWPTRFDSLGAEQVSDTEDWVGCVAKFRSGVTGVFESVKTATGYAGGITSRDYCEVNGSDGAVVYELSHPLRVLRARAGGAYEAEAVPEAFRKIAGSPRDGDADPYQAFRYDQDFEFVEAIHAGRPCAPSFADGLRVQVVMAAIQQSAREQRAVAIEELAQV